MIGLIRAELLRFVSRRLFRLLGALAVAGLLVAAVVAFVTSSNDPNAGLADARREADLCLREQARFIAEHGPETTGQFTCPSVEELRTAYDKRFFYADTIPNASRGVAAALFVLSVVVAASFVGAEWGTGSMTTLLTWEPRRGRVLAAKVITAGALLALATALLLALFAVVFLPVANLRGTTKGFGRTEWWTLAGIWARGAGLSAFGAAIATGVATIARNTVAVVGAAFAYGVILDPILGAIRRGRLRPWLLQHNVPRLLGFENVPQAQPELADAFVTQQMTLGPARPAVLFAIYVAAILAIAYAALRWRDVT